MSFTKGCTNFGDFLKSAYDAAFVEPHANRFEELSKKGDREGMIKVLLEIPCIEKLKIVEWYRGKDDAEAAELYGKYRGAMAENGNVHEQMINRSSILTETLFTASATSRLFLDALLDCAQYWYHLKAFAKCLKYCECMLALPENLYSKTTASSNDFSERREACIRLERECLKMLKISSSQGRRSRRKCKENRSGLSMWNRAQTIPIVDGKPNDLLKSCSDAVSLRFDEKRGRHLVATRNIRAGSVLIVETPFAFCSDKQAFQTNCFHCLVTLNSDDSAKIPCRFCRTVSFCSEKCRREAWQTYHRYECFVFDIFYENRPEQTQRRHASHLSLAYRMIVSGLLSNDETRDNNNDTGPNEIPYLNENFLRHCVAPSNQEFSELGVSEAYTSRDYRAILNLETHCTDIEPSVNLTRAIEAIFLARCFTFALSKANVVCSNETFVSLAVAMLHHLQAINYNAYDMVENVYDKERHVWEPRNVGGAIYPSVSLVNHSCYPNVVRHSYPSGIVVARTLRFIGKGTEILDCYGPHWLSEKRLSRREYLWKKYCFLCACEACAQNWQYPIPETMNLKCRTCSEPIGVIAFNEKDAQNASIKPCCNRSEKIDAKRIRNQLRKSVDKRLNAVSKMYEGHYEQALPQLLEHVEFIEKFFAAPNMETIKTQQCIIQCYNQFGCTSQ